MTDLGNVTNGTIFKPMTDLAKSLVVYFQAARGHGVPGCRQGFPASQKSGM
jgi:hypothetical protein